MNNSLLNILLIIFLIIITGVTIFWILEEKQETSEANIELQIPNQSE